jgi:hypothetical protein
LPSAGPAAGGAPTPSSRRDCADGMTVYRHRARARWRCLRFSGSRRRHPGRDYADGMTVDRHRARARWRRRLETARAASGLGNRPWLRGGAGFGSVVAAAVARVLLLALRSRDADGQKRRRAVSATRTTAERLSFLTDIGEPPIRFAMRVARRHGRCSWADVWRTYGAAEWAAWASLLRESCSAPLRPRLGKSRVEFLVWAAGCPGSPCTVGCARIPEARQPLPQESSAPP